MTTPERDARRAQARWASRVAPIVGALLSVAFVLQVLLSQPLPSWLYISLLVVGAAASLVAGVLPMQATRRQEIQLLNAESMASRREQILLRKVLGYLIPLSATIECAVSASDLEEAAERRSQLVQSIVDVALSDLFPSQARCCYFTLKNNSEKVRYLECDNHFAGRGDMPTYKFRENRGAGAQVFSTIIDARSSELNENIERARFPEWYPELGFCTYIACAVWSGDDVYGMLTMDAPDAQTLQDNHHNACRLLAQLLGSVLGAVSDKNKK